MNKEKKETTREYKRERTQGKTAKERRKERTNEIRLRKKDNTK